MKRRTIALGIAIALLTAPASAQVTLGSITVSPTTPTTTDSVVASASGMVNVSDLPTFRTAWKIEGNNVLMDVLHDYVPAGAPPQMLPYTQQAALGSLPAGNYHLTARLFSWFRDFPGPTYEEPWTFPPSDLRLQSTLNTTFTVVPEPSSFVLVFVWGLLLLSPRHR
jgi:hypothetical protein